jgi:hypothetical protein
VLLARRAAAAVAEVGDPTHRARVLGTLGQAFAEAGRASEAAAVLTELAAVPNSAGTAALIEAYLALGRGDHPAAADAFESAANLLAGRDDVRDVLEALTGLAASAEPPRRDRALEELAGLRGRGRMALLAREHRLLAAPLKGTDLATAPKGTDLVEARKGTDLVAAPKGTDLVAAPKGTDEDPLAALTRLPT